MKRSLAALLFAALLFAGALAVPALAQRDAAPRREVPTIAVTGNGETRVEPDEATVRVGVTRQGERAREAQEQVNVVANKILAAVAGLGIEKSQVQTAQLNLFPIFAPQKPGSNDPPKIVAYGANNVVSIRTPKLDLVGAIIDAALAAGANEVQGVSFDLRNDGPARRQALSDAAREAREKARTLAETLDVKLGPIQEVQESGVSVRPLSYAGEGVAMMRAAAAPTPVAPGQVTVSATVTIRYRIAE